MTVVASVVRGEAVGRRSNSRQRILVYNIGLAVHDILICESDFEPISYSRRNGTE